MALSNECNDMANRPQGAYRFPLIDSLQFKKVIRLKGSGDRFSMKVIRLCVVLIDLRNPDCMLGQLYAMRPYDVSDNTFQVTDVGPGADIGLRQIYPIWHHKTLLPS